MHKNLNDNQKMWGKWIKLTIGKIKLLNANMETKVLHEIITNNSKD
jgi:hypothetical protein